MSPSCDNHRLTDDFQTLILEIARSTNSLNEAPIVSMRNEVEVDKESYGHQGVGHKISIVRRYQPDSAKLDGHMDELLHSDQILPV
jgi:hypothetical protein